MNSLKNLFKNEKGQDMVEYALLAAFISIAAIVVVKAIGPYITAIYQNVENALHS